MASDDHLTSSEQEARERNTYAHEVAYPIKCQLIAARALLRLAAAQLSDHPLSDKINAYLEAP